MESSLCLACASSLPQSSQHYSYRTPCCGRIICASCLSKNTRLKQYNPCLSCLGGAGVVSSALQTAKRGLQVNGVHEDDVFIVGDSDDDEKPHRATPESPDSIQPSDAATALSKDVKTEGLKSIDPWKDANQKNSPRLAVQQQDATLADYESRQKVSPSKTSLVYWIKPGDTLSGISLKFGVDGRLLCRINQLSPSTLTTTPHLLHTRTTLNLPPTIRRVPSPPPPDAEERLARRVQERATKRLQFVTKELDTHVARTYVHLAEGSNMDDEDLAREVKEKGKSGSIPLSLEDRAVSNYLEDEAWEAQQRASGRGPNILPFPFFSYQKLGQGSNTGLQPSLLNPFGKSSRWSLFGNGWP